MNKKSWNGQQNAWYAVDAFLLKGAKETRDSVEPGIVRTPRRPHAGAGLLLALLVVALVSGVAGCHRGLPAPDSKRYKDYVSAFYTGLAALQVGDDVRAEKELGRSCEIVPAEPSGWANWAILRLRQRDFDAAGARLETARKLAPKSDRLYYLLGLVETGKGKSTEAIADFRRAVELNPKNLVATYELAQEVERQGGANSDAEFKTLMQGIVEAQPGNVAALLELGRVAAKLGDSATLKWVVAAIGEQAHGWPPEVQQQFDALQLAALGAEPRQAALRTTFLRNVMMRMPQFRRDLNTIKPQPGEEAQPFTHFLRLATPIFTPAPADAGLSFQQRQIEGGDGWSWIGAISLSDSGAATVVRANGGRVLAGSGAQLPFPGGAAKTAPSPEGILGVDLNYDFKTDLVLAGAGGVRFFRQETPENFVDVTARTKLPANIVNGSYTGAWAVDIEADGDLDVVLGSKSGRPLVLRNNGDDTFVPLQPFDGVSGVRGFVWADLNGDGNPDAAILDGTGQLRVFANERAGKFGEQAVPKISGEVDAITAADASHSGVLNLLLVRSDGSIMRLAEREDSSGWESAEIARVPDAASFLRSEVRLHVADLDNNGAIDLMLGRTTLSGEGGGAIVWLGDTSGRLLPPQERTGAEAVFGTGDVEEDGRLDLLGLSKDGHAIEAVNHGSKKYHWQIIRPRAKQAVGDQRINSFGVGGEIEIRSGLLVQMQPITGPQVHFGLGEQEQTDVARILWPNGSVRAEFALKADQQVVTEQRLKGSCPFLFAYNGKEMNFVKDAVPWGSAIGLRINNIGTAAIAATEEWYKIGRDQLVPRNGYYDLRITGELWETYYYDYLSLLTVDHPAGTEIFTDERFVVPAQQPRIVAVDTPRPITSAVDDRGNDVSAIVRTLDGKYLDDFGRGPYQGVTRDHFVEVDLGDDIPNGPLYLIAQGWLHPSDSSVNVAISQGSREQGRPLSLEVPDGHGGWKTARANMGFPAGRKKICLLDLTGLFAPGNPHRVRLRTNLEVYWDAIEWAHGRSDVPLKITRSAPHTADLHYRGYSVIHQQDQSSPEIPEYGRLASTGQSWRDLEGYYTRYGDVGELLHSTDDRYVIMNAGDEISLRFASLPELASGWVRDYVIAGDGWIKDGDYNSTYSRSMLPLPHHDRRQYETKPGRLEDEWVYQHHAQDWQDYHTRYVSPGVFRSGLREVTP